MVGSSGLKSCRGARLGNSASSSTGLAALHMPKCAMASSKSPLAKRAWP